MWQFGNMASGGATIRAADDRWSLGNSSRVQPEGEDRPDRNGPRLGHTRVQPEDYFNNIIFFTVTKLPASSL